MQKNWFTVFNVKVTARAYIIKIWLYLLYLLNSWSVCNETSFDSTASWKMGLLHQRRFKMTVNVCLDHIFWITEHFVTKFGMVIQHHEAESCGHFVVVTIFKVKGSYSQNMTLSVILSELLIPWQPILVWWYIIRSQSVLWKKWITTFRVKVTEKGQMFVSMISS